MQPFRDTLFLTRQLLPLTLALALTRTSWWWRENDKQYARQDRNDKVGGTPGTAKYVRFYSQWLPRVSPELFGGAACPEGRRFADLGASPGGLCEYLVGSLGWTGCAFSLPVAANGFGMSFTHRDLG
mgnify:CR=1 FL=1